MHSDTSSEASPHGGADIRTFLFADVRGYTRYTREQGDEAASLLAVKLAQVVREVVPGFHGDLVELRGDEAVSVFFSAREAIRAAVEVQRRLREQREGESTFPLGVGMGIDSGEVVPTEGGFRGGALNLAARLCAIAKPGQILASDHCAHLAGRVDGVRLTERRPVRLKGMGRPVRLMEVISEIPLPPLQSAAPRRRLGASRLVAVTVVAIAALAAVVSLAASQLGGGSHAQRVMGDSAAALDGSGGVLASALLGGEPSALTVGGNAVWVASTTTDQVLKVDQHSGRVVDHVQVGRAPSAVAVDRSGRLWVANNGDGTVWWLDPEAAKPLLRKIPVGNGPVGVAVGLGSIWVANQLDDTLTRINQADGTVRGTIPLASAPDAVIVADHAVWVATDATNSVVRVTPRPPYGEEGVPTGGDGPVALAAEGTSIWTANQSSDTVSRIDAQRGFVTGTVPVGRSPSAITVSDGSVWVANKLSGTISVIDPRSLPQLERTVPVGGAPDALAAGPGGRTWVAALPPLSSHRGGTLRIAATATIGVPAGRPAFETIDPAEIYFYSGAIPPVWDVYDGLVGYRRVAGSAGAAVVPDLATSIPQPTDRGRTWTFHLRRGLHYSNGVAVHPSDVRRAIERLFPLASPAATYFTFDHLVGVRRCQHTLVRLERRRPGRSHYPMTCDLRQAIATNDRLDTVTFHLTSRDPQFLQELAEPYADPVPSDTPNHDVGGHAIPGTGPYRIVRFQKGHSIQLARNPRFHEWSHDAQPQGYPNRIVITAYPSATAEFHAVETGKADISWDSALTGSFLPPGVVRQATIHFPDQVKAAPFPFIHYLVLDTAVRPFSSPLVRRAISDAIDRKRAVRYFAGAVQAFPSCQYLPVDFPAYRPYCPSTITPNSAGTYQGPDIVRAQRLIRESGMKGAKITVYLQTGTTPQRRDRRWGEYLASMLDSIHLRAHVMFGTNPPSPDQVYTQGWIEDFPLPSDFLDALFSCRGIGNGTRFCSRHLDREMKHAESLQLTDPGRANARWDQIEHALLSQPPNIPLIQQQWVNLIGKSVGDYQLHILIGPLVDQLWVK